MEFVDGRGRGEGARIARRAEDEARRIERKFSRYREESVVSEINRNAGRTPVAVDEETNELVGSALGLVTLTEGRFDPSIGVLRRAWDFRSGRVPSQGEIDALLPLVDASRVSLRDGTVFLRHAGLELDLGGVGKEYAADRVARILRDEGVAAAIVNFAGDVRTVGRRLDRHPWKIGVRHPRDPRRIRFAVRPMADAGVATSGDYERGFVRDGARYHHILDARTGWPAMGVASVTVVGASADTAGRYASAAFLLGIERGHALLESTKGLEGALIAEDGVLHATSGMKYMSDLPGSALPDSPYF
ncbi:MAG: FAD:protein FMN transferase [Deltaproteobacteria bacterium]|nr:FAD:protein FMN transferase [Deltaproteobacteria bacterium]